MAGQRTLDGHALSNERSNSNNAGVDRRVSVPCPSPRGSRNSHGSPGSDMMKGMSTLPKHFPMYGVSCATALLMETVVLHEQLRDSGNLHVVKSRSKTFSKVLFISHTWLGSTHPDPSAQQLRALQRILRRLASGRRGVHCNWFEFATYGERRISGSKCRDHFSDALLWMDYWCVPQASDRAGVAQAQKMAIHSIPAYTARADYFLVLAPPCVHVDYGEEWGLTEWRSRAWCRLELIAHYFARGGGGTVLIGESESQVRLDLCLTWLYNPPGEGHLSCCQLGHKIVRDGRESQIPCDKEAIGEVLETLYMERLDRYLAAGDLESYRVFLSLRQRVFAGLPAESLHFDDCADEFLRRYRFKRVTEEEGRRGSGWSPLRCAAYEQNLEVMRVLLEGRADVECPTRARRCDVLHSANLSILCGALRVHGDPGVVKLLLEHRASLTILTAPEMDQPSEHCVNVAGLQALMDHGYQLGRVTNIFNGDVLHRALFWAQLGIPCEDLVHFVLASGIAPRCTSFGFSHLHVAVQTGVVDMVKLVLANPEQAAAARSVHEPFGMAKMITRFNALVDCFAAHPAVAFFSEWPRASPLHVAAAEGFVRMIDILMDSGFELDARNGRGRTPIHMACLFGHELVLQRFSVRPGFEEAALLRCTYTGDTARDLAIREGFVELLRILPEQDDSGRSTSCLRRLCPRLRSDLRFRNDPWIPYDGLSRLGEPSRTMASQTCN